MARSCMCGPVNVNAGLCDLPPHLTTFFSAMREAARKKVLTARAREEFFSNIDQVLEGVGSASVVSYFKEWLEDQIEAHRSQVDLPPNSSSPNGDGLLILTDRDVLDCPICFNRLSIPVYQCKNGHVSCESCCIKMGEKCGQCRSRIGYSRCRAIEKVLESILSSCHFNRQGCTAIFSYSEKEDHEKSCRFRSCTCPHGTCSHITTFTELYCHFRVDHSQCTNEFRFNEPISIPLVRKQADFYFQEEKDGTLFILHKFKQNYFTLLCVAPESSKGFSYHLFARYERSPEEMNSIEITSIAANISGKVPDPLHPSAVFGRRMKLMSPLTLTIRNGDD